MDLRQAIALVEHAFRGYGFSRMSLVRAGAFLAIFLISGSAMATDYYVSVSGADTQPGTLAQPWRTIQKAANTLQPGDTVYVRGGTYARTTLNVSGTGENSRITFAGFPGETPVIDATGETPPSGETALFLIQSKKWVTFRGFELRNYQTANRNLVPAGVHISGACEGIEIRDCDIHDIVNTGGNTSHSGNAFGIAVYGSSTTPTTKIVIDGNNIHDLKTGSSECLVVNGNVTDFQVTRNQVHDCNNIGIDFIGFEGTCPDAAQDQARDGVCRGNVVWNITSQGNQAYTAGDYSAGGIYCDGAARVTIEGNTSHHNDIGIELAAELAGKVTSGIILRNNVVYASRQVGLFMGGYASSGTGGTKDCTVTGNTFYNNDTLKWGNGEIQLRYRTQDCIFTNNILSVGGTGPLVTIPVTAANNVNNRFNHNLYFATTPVWKWNNTARATLAAWQTASAQDTASLFIDPRFTTTTGSVPDLHLRLDSPAVNAGDPGFTPSAGETDLDGGKRMTGPRVDIGADELAPVDAWRVKSFGTNATLPEVAGDLASPALDGIPNLVKYALSLDPALPSLADLPAIIPQTLSDGGYPVLLFRHSLTADDVSCLVQVSDDLVHWQDGSHYGSGGDVPINSVTTEVSRTPHTGYEVIAVRGNRLLSADSRQFMRLVVTRQ